MKYAVIGTGAIGGYYGSKLARAGKEVHFLLHSDYEEVKRNGLVIDSYEGNYVLPHVNAYCSVNDMPQVDVVIVALKSVSNHLLADLLPPLLHPNTLVLLIQNGIGVEEDVQKMFPETWLAAGLAFICSSKIGAGHIHHQFYGNINIGNYSCHDEEKVTLLIREMREAGIGAALVDYAEARWKKAVWNMPFNGMTVALNTQTIDLVSNPHTCQLIRMQGREVVRAAQALGVKNIDDAFVEKMIDNTLSMPPYSPSMKLDYDYHRPMEIHYLYTRPIEMAQEAGIEMPLLKMLETELLFIESRQNTAKWGIATGK